MRSADLCRPPAAASLPAGRPEGAIAVDLELQRQAPGGQPPIVS